MVSEMKNLRIIYSKTGEGDFFITCKKCGATVDISNKIICFESFVSDDIIAHITSHETIFIECNCGNKREWKEDMG